MMVVVVVQVGVHGYEGMLQLGFPGTREGTQIGNRVPRVTGKMQA